MIKETFFDALVSISIIGDMVRLDFGSFDAEAGPVEDGKEPPMVVRQRVIMPINSFAQSFGMQEEMIKKLLEDKVIQKVSAEEAKAKGLGSPNFKQ